jgi:hypothetical protein
VDEITQGSYYRRALQLAFCQPNVAGVLLFHTQDEPALASWQSGVYYADGTPKGSLYPLRDALRRTRGGSITRCTGLELPVPLTAVRFPTAASFKRGDRAVRFRCSLDCAWELKASAATGVTTTTRRGFGRGGDTVTTSLKGRRLGVAPLRLVLQAVHPVNPGTPTVRESGPLAPG